MKQDEIIEMAEFCFEKSKNQTEFVQLFAKLVAEHERQACVKVVEAWSDWHGGTETLAKAIRARGQA